MARRHHRRGENGNRIHVYKGNGGAAGRCSGPRAARAATNNVYTGIALSDLNKDGDLDIVAADYQNSGTNVHLWIRRRHGPVDVPRLEPAAGTDLTMGVAVGDFDLDGNNDIVYGTRDAAMRVCSGNGGGSDGASFCWTSADSGMPTTGRVGPDYRPATSTRTATPTCSAPARGAASSFNVSDGGVGGSLD